MGACGSKVLWETAGTDPMDDLRKRGRETGWFRDAPEQKDDKEPAAKNPGNGISLDESTL